MTGIVTAVSRSASHTMRKGRQSAIELVTGLGVEGDTHAGVTVQHRSRVALNPNQPNLRQVHLIHAELHDELRDAGFRHRCRARWAKTSPRKGLICSVCQRVRGCASAMRQPWRSPAYATLVVNSTAYNRA